MKLEEEGHFSRGKGLISHDYGCMWFYAMGSMYMYVFCVLFWLEMLGF